MAPSKLISIVSSSQSTVLCKKQLSRDIQKSIDSDRSYLHCNMLNSLRHMGSSPDHTPVSFGRSGMHIRVPPPTKVKPSIHSYVALSPGLLPVTVTFPLLISNGGHSNTTCGSEAKIQYTLCGKYNENINFTIVHTIHCGCTSGVSSIIVIHREL